MRSLRLLAALSAAPLFAATASTSPLDQMITLPEFKVFENLPLPPREKWTYAKVGNFEILSNTSERTTKRFAKDLSEFQIVLGIVAPNMLIRAEQPVMVVLCGKNSQFERFRVKSAIAPAPGQVTSLVRDNEIASIVVDFETRSVDETGSIPVAGAGGESWLSSWFSRDINTTDEFIRQYIHLSLSQLSPRPPAWVAEGLANIYSNIEYNNKWIEIGLPKSFINEVTSYSTGSYGMGGYSGSGYGDYYNTIGSAYYGNSGIYGGGGYPSTMVPQSYTYRIPIAFMPMEKLFAVTYDSPLLKASAKDDAMSPGWKTQATAFVHMCLYGAHGKYRRPFLKFVARTYHEPVSEELFKECFGVSYKEMALRIRGYTEFTDYVSTTIKATSGGILYPADPINIRPANDAEIGRIKGETYRLALQDDAARREFVTAYLRGERDPQLLASLGLMARQRDDFHRARIYLEAVMTTKDPVPRPRAYLELARLRAITYAAQTGSKPYDTAQTIGLLAPLFVAQRQPQQLVDIYLEIARVWENSAVVPERDHLGALEYGVRLFPQSGELALRTAALLIKHGYKADAAPLIERSLNSTRNPELKTKLELLRQKVAGGSGARPGLSLRFSLEANLGPELRQRVAEYRAAKTAAVTELRAQLAATDKFSAGQRESTLAAFAAVQTPRLRALEREAVRLEADLGWPPDEGDDYAPGLTDFSPDTAPEARDQLRLFYAALQRPQGLSPPQASLLREMILEAQSGAASRGAFLFFAPATARVRFPADLPPALSGEIAAFTREKEALKTDLRNAIADSAGSASEVVRMIGFGALAEQQAPRFIALGARADAIRRALEQLPPRPASGASPALPAVLAARLTAYQNQRSELQQNSRRDLRVLRSGLAATGAELVASGDPPRLSLQITTELTPELTAKRAAVEAFNRDYAERAAALNRELAELRRLLADAVPPSSAHGKSVNDLIQDFTTAALRQASAEMYRDCRAAVFQPGLSPEQRRLLFGRTAEKQASLVFEL